MKGYKMSEKNCLALNPHRKNGDIQHLKGCMAFKLSMVQWMGRLGSISALPQIPHMTLDMLTCLVFYFSSHLFSDESIDCQFFGVWLVSILL